MIVSRLLFALVAGLSIAVLADPVGEITKRTGALLSRNDLSTTCEVVIVNEKFGLIAASCLIYTSPGVIDPAVKYTVVYNQGGDYAYTMSDVQKILPHPNYNPNNFANNLAILTLSDTNTAPFSNPIADWPSEWQTFYYVQRAGAPNKHPTWSKPKVVSAQNSTTDIAQCKTNSFIYGLNQYDFICSPLSLPTTDANCVMPYGVIYQYDGTQAVVAALLSHSASQGSSVFCSTSPVYNYYTIINNYITWIQNAVGTGVNAYHSPNAVGYVPSSDPFYQMKQEEIVVVVAPNVQVPAVIGIPAEPALPVKPVVPQSIIINDGDSVAPVTETVTSVQVVSMPITISTMDITSETSTTTTTATTTSTTTATTVSVTTVTQTQISVITVPGLAGNGNQSVGVNIGVNVPTVTVVTTATSTSTITVTAPPTAVPVPVNPVVVTGNVPAPVTVTVTTTAGASLPIPATITTTTTAISYVAGAVGVTIIPITQWMPTTETSVSTVTSTVTSLLPVTITANPKPTEPAPSATPTTLPSEVDEPVLNVAAIIAIVLLSLLAIAAVAFFIIRKKKKRQNRAQVETNTSRVREWFFFGRNQNRESFRGPSRMSELPPPSYR
ncbi:hypothetical protein GGH92_001534 [Coemansia sp. RSA 2673]|nr:hypothetical protein GGH92_001534 [Coemansia sp. RSA 2673]